MGERKELIMNKKNLVMFQNHADVLSICDILSGILSTHDDITEYRKKKITISNTYLAEVFMKLTEWMKVITDIDISTDPDEEFWVPYKVTFLMMVIDQNLPALGEDEISEVAGSIPSGFYIRFIANDDLNESEESYDLVKDLEIRLDDTLEIYFAFSGLSGDLDNPYIDISVGQHTIMRKRHGGVEMYDIDLDELSDVERAFYNRIKYMIKEV